MNSTKAYIKSAKAQALGNIPDLTPTCVYCGYGAMWRMLSGNYICIYHLERRND